MADYSIKDVFEGVVGAAGIAFSLLTPMLRPVRVRWGATDEEIVMKLPGDEFVPTPKWRYTHAVTIRAPVAEVWKWLVQMGYQRGGLYSYQWLESVIGCEMHNADKIIPEYQSLNVGDSIYIDSRVPPLPVALIDPLRTLVLHGKPTEDNEVNTTWGFYLFAIDAHSTRLIARSRSDYAATTAMRLTWGPLLIEPVTFVMERKMLLGIKARAEARQVAYA